MKIKFKILKGDTRMIDSELELTPLDSTLNVWKDKSKGIRIIDTENELETIAKRHKSESEFYSLHLFSDNAITGKLLFIEAIKIISIIN